MQRPQRVSVVGTSGSGKTTFARRLAATLGVPHIELDAIFHQPNWTPLPDDEFTRRVEEATRGEQWVVDGQYTRVTMRGPVWERADTVIVFALPRTMVMRQIATRSVRRAVTRETLWNGNRERVRNLLHLNPERNVVLWAWTRHRTNRERYLDAARDEKYAHLRFVFLTSHEEAEALLASLGTTTSR